MRPFKKLNLRYALLITALVFFSACSKPTYYDITFDESLWMSYDDGQEAIFLQKGTLNLDTLVFYNKIKGYVEEGDTYEEFISIKFKIRGDTIAFQNEGLLRLSKDGEGFSVYAEFPHHPQGINPQLLIPAPVVNINTAPYFQVYHSVANPLLLNQIARIQHVWLNKEVGFVKYRDIAGNEWGLIP